MRTPKTPASRVAETRADRAKLAHSLQSRNARTLLRQVRRFARARFRQVNKPAGRRVTDSAARSGFLTLFYRDGAGANQGNDLRIVGYELNGVRYSFSDPGHPLARKDSRGGGSAAQLLVSSHARKGAARSRGRQS